MNIVKISLTSFDSQIKPKVYKMLNKFFFKLKILFMNGMISEYFFFSNKCKSIDSYANRSSKKAYFTVSYYSSNR